MKALLQTLRLLLNVAAKIAYIALMAAKNFVLVTIELIKSVEPSRDKQPAQ